MINNLSILEKQSVYKVLIDIANADNIVTKEETAYIFKLQKNLDIPIKKINEALKMDFSECLKILKEVSDVDKKVISGMILELIKADGNVDHKEIELFSEIYENTDIPMPKDIKNTTS